jgi:hypothetical protein
MVIIIGEVILHKLPFSSSVILFSSLLVLLILTIITVVLSLNIIALGQSSSSSSSSSSNTATTTQLTWIDKLSNLKIQFGYLPKEPVIDKPTELNFAVQNLQTGDQIKNLSARVIVINNAGGQQRSFKFTNITAPNGTFSVKYLFPDSGLYNIVTKIDSKDFTSLASFNVPVPLPPLSSIVNVGNLNSIVLPAIGGGIIAAIVGTALVWMNRKKSN